MRPPKWLRLVKGQSIGPASDSEGCGPQQAVRIPVRFIQEQPGGSWCFVVELPVIIGGPCASQEEAARSAIQAIARSTTPRGAPEPCAWQVVGYLSVKTDPVT